VGEGASERADGIAALAGEHPVERGAGGVETLVDIDPVPGDPQRAVLTRVEPLALADSDIKSDDAARNALSTLIDSKYIQQAH
jgi:hypothetical protein